MVRVLKQFSHKPLAYISDIEKTYFQTHVLEKALKISPIFTMRGL